MQRFDHLFSVSEAAQKAAKELYGVDSEILPCPIDIEQANRIDNIEDKENNTVITFLGRIVARKGLATLLDSVELLGPEIQDKLQLNIVGDGVDRGAFERRVSKSGIKDITHFYGAVSDKRKYELLASSDIVACPSSGGESFGVVLVEAIATGKPVVVASNIGGYAEVLSGIPDALVAKNDPQALAARIKAIMDSPDRKQALFSEQQRAVRQFDTKHAIGPRLMQAYGLTRDQIDL
jgi:phosphatidylinositol alpha-mannosyltransferase